MQILLKDVVLFGLHGVHPLEKKVGTLFKINIQIDLDPGISVQSLSDTLDYAQVFALLKKEFQVTEDLLEVLIERIISSIALLSSNIKIIDISIIKLNAPINGFQGEVGVRKQKQIK
ncbi:MAG: dihydroneopterin aldolase [Bacteroidota bacterium]